MTTTEPTIMMINSRAGVTLLFTSAANAACARAAVADRPTDRPGERHERTINQMDGFAWRLTAQRLATDDNETKE